MITKLFLTTVLSFLFSIGLIQHDEALPANSENTSSDRIVKGIMYEGSVIPMVELPTIEITGDLEQLTLVPGQMLDGVIIPSYELPEVVISPNV